MGASRSMYTFPSFLMAGSARPHPFAGLPWTLLEQVGSLSGVMGYANDFQRWEGPIAEGSAGGITLTGVTGTADITRAALNNIGGVIRLGTSATADGNANLEIPLQVGVVANQDLWCFARVALSDVSDMDFHFGLGTPGTTDWIAALPAEGIFFALLESEGNGTVDFIRRDASTSTVQHADMVTLADNTFVVLGFHKSAAGILTPYHGTNVMSLTAGTASNSVTNLPDDAADELSLFFNVETGDSAVDYADIDWLICAQTRTADV